MSHVIGLLLLMGVALACARHSRHRLWISLAGAAALVAYGAIAAPPELGRWAVLILFAVMYALFMILPDFRGAIAMIGGTAFIALGAVGPVEAVHAVEWNVMAIFMGVLLLADLFLLSRVPAYLSEVIISKSPNVGVTLLLMCAITSFISLFVENVAAVLIVAPIGFAICGRLRISPIPLMVGMAVSSNLQGCATLIGDPPSMLLAGALQLSFNDFFVHQGRPGIFWAVQAGAAASFVVLYLFFRRWKKPVEAEVTTEVISWLPTFMLVLLVLSLITISFFCPTDYALTVSGAACLLFGLAGIVYHRTRKDGGVWEFLRRQDWQTFVFLLASFVAVESLAQAGWLDRIGDLILRVSGDSPFVVFLLLVYVSVLFSAFVDNVPYLVAMIAVGQRLADHFSIQPELFLFGLLLGASLGGNLTPIGASANVVAFGQLRQRGHPATLASFLRIGVPFTFAAVTTGAAFIWIFWS